MAAWRRVTGEDISGGTPLWLNAFGDANRQAACYRRGRVLLAGDAAHRQMPIGGQALNLGLQDAVNLGWKLAAQVRGHAPAGLLDTYHAERHAVGRRVLANIRAQAAILLGDSTVEPLRALLGELLAIPAARAHLAAMISGVDVRYDTHHDIHHDTGDRSHHPLLGRRLPLDLAAPVRAAARAGGWSLLDRAGSLRAAAEPWGARITVAGAGTDLGHGAAGVLVRPDGHVAWAGADPRPLRAALRRWLGPPDPHRADDRSRGPLDRSLTEAES
ncbi:FAD-dependent monooxygenase [Actinokineospora sp. G85]|uniref:FAD-dependent monooxygenase n=1 Tax=Actinokineospora sp. G85 TaxID=3406626 RepID=UPI003C75BCCD